MVGVFRIGQDVRRIVRSAFHQRPADETPRPGCDPESFAVFDPVRRKIVVGRRVEARSSCACTMPYRACKAAPRTLSACRAPSADRRRAADHLEHVGGRGLLLQRFGQVARALPEPHQTAAHSRSRSPPGRQSSTTSSICFSVNGATVLRHRLKTPIGSPSRSNGTPSRCAKPALLLLLGAVFRVGQHVRDLNGLLLEQRPADRAAAPRLERYCLAVFHPVDGKIVVGCVVEMSVSPCRATVAISASQSRAADSVSVSSTVCRSKVERLMTLSTSAVAVCCCRDSRDRRFACAAR